MDIRPLVEGLEKLTAKENAPQEGDYVENGLWYCGKCHTPKQCRIEIFGAVKFPFCLCKCGKEAREASEKEAEREQEQQRIRSVRNSGFSDAGMVKLTFDQDDGSNPKLSEVARRYVENFAEMLKRGKGLLLFGSVGTGKTFAACCIANALIDQGYSCMVTNFARLVNTLMSCDDRQGYIDSLNWFDLLVIDDLAAERQTEYMQECVTNIIDARYRAGKPLIITTNLTADELKNPADMQRKRVYSRLFELCVPFEVGGIDRRKEALKRDYSELQGLLGIKGD